jgi:hypothetical protein
MDYQIIGLLIYHRIGCMVCLGMGPLVEEDHIIILTDNVVPTIRVGMVDVKDMAQGIQESQWVVVAVVVEEAAMEAEVVVAIINLEQL